MSIAALITGGIGPQSSIPLLLTEGLGSKKAGAIGRRMPKRLYQRVLEDGTRIIARSERELNRRYAERELPKPEPAEEIAAPFIDAPSVEAPAEPQLHPFAPRPLPGAPSAPDVAGVLGALGGLRNERAAAYRAQYFPVPKIVPAPQPASPEELEQEEAALVRLMEQEFA